MRLDGTKSAVVTGAASGIGAALARDLDRRGVRLALADLDLDRLRSVSGELKQTPVLMALDVSDRESMEAFAAKALEANGTPDLVVANAGVSLVGDFLNADQADWEWLFGVNFWGVVHTNRAFASAMVDRGSGTLVNISSLFGLIGVPNCAAYCATKAAVRGFTESIQQELHRTGVSVCSVHPGGVATRIAEDGRTGTMVGKMSRERSAKIISRGMPPEKAAAIILSGVERGKKRVLVGRDAWLLDKIQRFAPVRYRDIVRWGTGLL